MIKRRIRRFEMKNFLVLLLLAIAATLAAARLGALPAAEQAALDRISAASLKTNLSYLASDELEGRGTPSHGLDLAADYIAAQFQHEGLSPAARDGSYFQVAAFVQVEPRMEGIRLLLHSQGPDSNPKPIEIPKDEIRVQSAAALDVTDGQVLTLPANGAIPPVEGMIVAGAASRYGREALLEQLQSRRPAMILLFGKTAHHGSPKKFEDDLSLHHAPVIRIDDAEAFGFLGKNARFAVSLHVPQPAVKQATLRNVAALLPGSDAMLRDQYVLLTAHYDHLGKTAKGIFHGANDNASGTASVIEIAGALATLNPHPKRSILFITFFGEEEGLLGSYYYAHSPLVPLSSTVANINLEQMGRTDDASGRHLLSFMITGPSFSNLPSILSDAAKPEGIATWRLGDADAYFARSDNYGLALHGVVAHTIAVAAEFPDYHALGDTSEKIDYENMARVDRGVAGGVLRVANEPQTPKWSPAPEAAVYREAAAR
jgi:hypothetical protein